MVLPVLLALDDDPDVLHQLREDLIARYGDGKTDAGGLPIADGADSLAGEDCCQLGDHRFGFRLRGNPPTEHRLPRTGSRTYDHFLTLKKPL